MLESAVPRILIMIIMKDHNKDNSQHFITAPHLGGGRDVLEEAGAAPGAQSGALL